MITLYDFVKRFTGKQINIFFEEFGFDNRDTYPPAITFYNTAGGDFEVDKFLWNAYDQLGQNEVLSFDCGKTCVNILVAMADNEEESE